VLDYACGEALSAAMVAEACSKLFLAEPAPACAAADRAFCSEHENQGCDRWMTCGRWRKARSLSPVMNSVVQYMTPGELDSALAVIRRLLKPSGRLVLGDILRPEGRHGRDVIALLHFAQAKALPERTP